MLRDPARTAEESQPYHREQRVRDVVELVRPLSGRPAEALGPGGDPNAAILDELKAQDHLDLLQGRVEEPLPGEAEGDPRHGLESSLEWDSRFVRSQEEEHGARA